MPPELPPPWPGFLQELGDLLDEPFEFQCVGGFAIVAAYGLPRSTNDLDYFSLIPNNRQRHLERLAGEASSLARRHKVHVHHAGIASVPENYGERLTELFPRRFKNIRPMGLDPYHPVLSKFSRHMETHRGDVQYFVRTQKSAPACLRQHYGQGVKP